MRLVYFASVRESVGRGAEEVDLPAAVRTVGDCVGWLAARGEAYQTAFAEPAKLRFAVDQQMADAAASITDCRELAIFPPVTGG